MTINWPDWLIEHVREMVRPEAGTKQTQALG
jgi:hypothetical protein